MTDAQPLTIPPPAVLRERIQAREEELRALRRLLRLAKAAEQVTLVSCDDREGDVASA